MRVGTLIVLLFLLLSGVEAQDKLLLLNGHVDRGKILEDKGATFDFKIYKNGGKEKTIPYDKYRIFSVTDIKGTETVLYKQDTTIGNLLTENQMRMYIYGQRDAHKNYKSSHLFIGGVALGLAAALFDTYEFGNQKEIDEAIRLNTAVPEPIPRGFFLRTPSIGPPLLPLVIPITIKFLPSKIMKEDVSDIGYLNSEEYVEGFKKVQQFKRIKVSFLGTLSGVAAGLIAYGIGK